MNRFKPGDKARVIGNKATCGIYHTIAIGAIVTLDAKGYYWEDESGMLQEIRACDLEPIEPVQEEESRPVMQYDSIGDPYYGRYENDMEKYADYLESTISNLRKELEELKSKA